MHTLLQRQLRKCSLTADAPTAEPVAELLRAVNSAYAQYDDDRRMLERSLELSSRELLAANSDMRALLQSLPDLFLRLDAGSVITDARGAPCAEYFPGHASAIGIHLTALVQGEAGRVLAGAVDAVRSDGQRRTVEYEIATPPGPMEYFEARIMGVFENQIIAIVRNISAVKTFEAAMMRERAYLRQVIDLDPNLVFAKDRDGRFTLANQAVADVYGTTVEGLLGKGDADFNANAAEVAKFRAEDQAVLDGLAERFIPEECITDASGRVRWLQTFKRPILDADGRAMHVLGVATDISQHKAAQHAQEARTAQILRQQAALQDLAAAEGADPSGTFGRACTVAAQVLGTARASIWFFNEARTEISCAWLHADRALQRDPGIVLCGADYPHYFAAIEEQLTVAAADARHDPRTADFTEGYLDPLGIGAMLDCAIRVDGRTAGVLCLEHVGAQRTWSLEEQDFAAALASFVALSLSIEDRRALETQLRHSQKMEAVGMLAGGIAHDFNNLLTAILGFSELLRSNPQLDDVARSQVSEIVKAGQRAADLTSQLLTFGRKQVRAPRVIGLNAVVADVSRLLRRVVGETIEFRTHPAASEVFVRADPHQIEQVLVNLVVNARDAMRGRAGVLCVRVGHQDVSRSGASRVGTLPSGTYAVLEVEDNGTGIDPTLLSRVFEPFFTTKPVGEGTGLGLAMVYGIAQQNGGHVELASFPGRGTTARVFLPLVADALPARNPLDDADGALIGGGETVLVVEDEAIVRLLAVELLRRLGYQVLVASRPSEALELLANETLQLDLLITDLVMPEMNGSALYQAARLSRPGLRVMFMSGYAPDSVLQDTALRPGSTYLQKPFTLWQLSDRVRHALESPAPAGAH